MKHTALIILLLLSVRLNGSVNNSSYYKELNHIKKTVFENPRLSLDRLNGLLNQGYQINDSLRGLTYLLMSSCYGMLNMPDSGIHCIKVALNKISDDKKSFAYKNLGNMYRLSGDTKQAIVYHQKALQLSDDSVSQCIVLGEIASDYSSQKDLLISLEYLMSAMNIIHVRKESEKDYALIIRQKLANTYLDLNNLDFAIPELEKLCNDLKKQNQTINYAITCLSLSDAYTRNRDYYKGLDQIKIASEIFAALQNNELAAYSKIISSRCYSALQDRKKALMDARIAYTLLLEIKSNYLPLAAIELLRILEKTDGFEEGIELINNRQLQDIIQTLNGETLLDFRKAEFPFIKKTKDNTRIYLAMENLLSLSDSLESLVKDREAIEIQSRYQSMLSRQDAENLRQKNSLLNKEKQLKEKQFLLWITISSSLILFLAYWGTRNKLKRKIREEEIESGEQMNSHLTQQISIALNENEIKEKIIEQQKSEMINYREEIQSLRLEIEKIKSAARNESAIDQLFSILQEAKGNKLQWESFMTKFSEAYPNFIVKLLEKYPELTPTDIQFCTLLRLNLPIKEISIILGIETDSAYKRKYRIMEKMRLGSQDNLENRLILLG